MVGDLVNTTGAVLRVRETFPDATFVLEGGSAATQLFPDVEVWVRERGGGLANRAKRILRYRAGGFDQAIALDDSRTAIRSACQAGIPKVIGASRKPFSHRRATVVTEFPGAHDLFDPLRAVLRAIGANDDVAPSLPLTAGHRALAGEHPTKKFVFHVGASDRAKSWPEDRWIELARIFRDDCIVGAGPGEEGVRDRVAAAAGVAVLPTLGLLEYAAILERAPLVVSADTSVPHLAAAVGTRSIVLYGPTDPARFHPWHLSTPLWHNLGCEHYGVGCRFRSGECSQMCMRSITAQEVAEAIKSP